MRQQIRKGNATGSNRVSTVVYGYIGSRRTVVAAGDQSNQSSFSLSFCPRDSPPLNKAVMYIVCNVLIKLSTTSDEPPTLHRAFFPL